MFRILALFALALATPAYAKPLTVRMGETWLFAVRDGAPVDARKTTSATVPAPGQLKVSLQPLFGATMTVTNASRFCGGFSYPEALPSFGA